MKPKEGNEISDFGNRLKAEREKLGYSLEEVSEETKIRTLYLKALEEENFDVLPPQVYAMGFVRNYTKFLHLDSQRWVEEFQRLAYPVVEQTPPVINTRPKRPRRKIKLPVKNIVTAAIFLAIVIWSGDLVANYIASRGTVPPPNTDQPQVTQPAPVEQKAADKLVLKIVARQKCWLQVNTDGQQQFSATMPVGETRVFEAKRTISIRAGNAGGIDLFLNDQALPPLGEVGQVAEKQFDIDSIAKE